MKKLNIIGENSSFVSFHIQSGNSLAVAEISSISRPILDTYLALCNPKKLKDILPHIDDNSIFFFNRLKVPDKITGKGFGNILLGAVTDYCKNKNITLINPINAYGPLNTQEVIEFHEKFNFNLLHSSGLVIYNAKIVRPVPSINGINMINEWYKVKNKIN